MELLKLIKLVVRGDGQKEEDPAPDQVSEEKEEHGSSPVAEEEGVESPNLLAVADAPPEDEEELEEGELGLIKIEEKHFNEFKAYWKSSYKRSRADIPEIGKFGYVYNGKPAPYEKENLLSTFCEAMLSGLHGDVKPLADKDVMVKAHRDIGNDNFVTTLVYVDLLVAILVTRIELVGLKISIRARDRMQVATFTSLRVATPVGVSGFIRSLDNYAKDFLARASDDYYLLCLRDILRGDPESLIKRLLPLREALVVLMLVRTHGPRRRIFMPRPPQLAAESKKESIPGQGIRIEDPNTVDCYRILLTARPKEVANIVLQIVEVQESSLTLSSRTEEAESFKKDDISLEFFCSLIDVCLSNGIVFDLHETTIYKDWKVCFRKLRLLTGAEQLAIYLGEPLVIEELQTLREFMLDLSSGCLEGSKTVSAYFRQIRDGSDTDFFYVPRDYDGPNPFGTLHFSQSKTIIAGHGLVMDLNQLPSHEGNAIVVEAVDIEGGAPMKPLPENDCTESLTITRYDGSRRKDKPLDLKPFTVLQELVYYDLTAPYLLPILPTSLKRLDLEVAWTPTDLQKALEELQKIEVVLRNYHFQYMPEAGIELENVTGLYLNDCTHTDKLPLLHLPNLQRISVQDHHLPLARPDTLVVSKKLRIEGGPIRFNQVESGHLDSKEVDWGKLQMSELLVTSDSFSRDWLGDHNIAVEHRISLDYNVAKMTKSNKSYAPIRWRFKRPVTLAGIRQLCTEVEMGNDMIEVDNLVIQLDELKETMRQKIRYQRLKLVLQKDMTSEDIKEHFQGEFTPPDTLERVIISFNGADTGAASKAAFAGFFKDIPLTFGPRVRV